MTESQEHDLTAGTILEERWRIEGLLGRGGFATVYRAAHIKLDRPAAVKVLDVQAPPGEMAKFHERFLREAKLSAQIEHPNVVQILDYGVLDMGQNYAQPFIVMEMLRGQDLEEELLEGGPLDPQRAWRLFDGALDALRVSHEMGIVHKDLKPSNLFVSRPGDENERLVVVDFGIARAYDDPDSKLTATNQFTGTPAYLAPEYIEQQEISPAVDVYQMGLIIAETLSGAPVVQASSPLSYLMAHCNGQQRIPPHLDGTPLGEVLTRAVQVDPADRYPDATALRAALAALDWSLVPPAGDAPVTHQLQHTNPLPPPLAYAATAAAMDTPASPHDVPTTVAPVASGSSSRTPILVALGIAGALALGGLGYTQRDALLGTGDVSATAPGEVAPGEVASVESASGEPTPSRVEPDPAPSTEDPVADAPVEPEPVAVADPPSDEPAPTGSGESPPTTDGAEGAPPAVATAASSSKPPKKKKAKVQANERIDLIKPDDADDKLKAAYDAYRVVGATPTLNRAAFLKRAEKSGLDAPDQTALSFSDMASTYRRGAKALDAVKSAKLKDPRLDSAAAALAPVMRDMVKLADESYTFRIEKGWTTDPKGLVDLDARWAKLMARFEPRRDAFIEATYDLERRTLLARFKQADVASSPVVHHWYGLLLNTSLAMAAAEGKTSGHDSKYTRLAEKHANALGKLDVHALIDKTVVGSSARNAIVGSARSARNSLKNIKKLGVHYKKASSALDGADAAHHVILGWSRLYMSYGALTRNVYKRTM